MRKLLIPLLAAFALPTAVNASGFWLLTTTVKKPVAFQEYVQEFKPWLKSVGGSLVMKDSDPQIVEGRGEKTVSRYFILLKASCDRCLQ